MSSNEMVRSKSIWTIERLSRYAAAIRNQLAGVESGSSRMLDVLDELDEKWNLIAEALGRVIALPDCTEADKSLVEFCISSSDLLQYKFLPHELEALFLRGLEGAKRVGSELEISCLYRLVGMSVDLQHQLDRAKELYELSYRSAPPELPIRERVEILGSLGNIACRRNELERALELQQQVLDYTQSGLPELVSKAHCSLGVTHNRMGNTQVAVSHFEMALETARNEIDTGNALGSLGSSYRRLGEYERAEATLRRRIELAENVGDIRGLRNSCGNLGNLLSEVGRLEESLSWHEKSLTLSEQMPDLGGQGIDLLNIGELHFKHEKAIDAIPYFERAVALFKIVGDKLREGIALENLAMSYGESGRFGDALHAGEQAIETFRGAGNAGGRQPLFGKYMSHWQERWEHMQWLEATAPIRDEIAQLADLTKPELPPCPDRDSKLRRLHELVKDEPRHSKLQSWITEMGWSNVAHYWKSPLAGRALDTADQGRTDPDCPVTIENHTAMVLRFRAQELKIEVNRAVALKVDAVEVTNDSFRCISQFVEQGTEADCRTFWCNGVRVEIPSAALEVVRGISFVYTNALTASKNNCTRKPRIGTYEDTISRYGCCWNTYTRGEVVLQYY